MAAAIPVFRVANVSSSQPAWPEHGMSYLRCPNSSRSVRETAVTLMKKAMITKQFRLSADQIRSVAVGYGSCIATNRITVDGAKVGYCYREYPAGPLDSGWRFFAGDESEEYTDDARNMALYDVNTIANYDFAITLLLDAPVGSEFELDEAGRLVSIDSEQEE